MDWAECWTQHIQKKGRAVQTIERFWERFFGALLALLATRDDYGSDYTNPELIEVTASAGVYVTLELDRLSEAVNVVYAVQRPVTYGRFFRIHMGVSDLQCEMGGFAVKGLRTPEEAAAVVFNRMEIVCQGVGGVADVAGGGG
jgi:hypothetical protein